MAEENGNSKKGGARDSKDKQMKRGGNPFRTVHQIAKEKARQSELLPHEWLAMIASGHPIAQSDIEYTYYKTGPRLGEVKSEKVVTKMVYPTVEMRDSAARAAAPYIAPKLATQMVHKPPPKNDDDNIRITYRRATKKDAASA